MTGPRRRAALLLVIFCAAFASARKGQAADTAYDPAASFAGSRSFAWFDDPKWVQPRGNAVVDSQFIDRTIRAAVEANLAKKGFAKVGNGATFFVAYAANDMGASSQNKWVVPPKWVIDEPFLQAETPTQRELSPALVEDSGTKYRQRSMLVLEIRDSQGKLIWRGSRTSATGASPEAVAKGIDHTVGKLLAHFPPKKVQTTK